MSSAASASSAPPADTTAASHALFLAASQFLPSAPSAASLPTASKLRLYGLFKLLTAGAPSPPGARPAFWQVEARGKWDAWAAAGKELASEGTLREAGKMRAREEYVQIARSVGFQMTEADVQHAAARPQEDDVDLDHLSSDDERDRAAEMATSSGARRVREAGGGGVGGKTISTLTKPGMVGDDEEASESVTEVDALSHPPWSLVATPGPLRDHLIAHPVDLSAYSPSGLTLLHAAADRDLPATVKLLLELGADRTLVDRPATGDEEGGDGMTALEMAECNGFDEVAALLRT